MDTPLSDYDNLTTQGIGHRIRTLERDDLVDLLEYEEDHAARPAVVQLMRTRLSELDDGAEPSGGSPDAWAPEAGSTTNPTTEAAVTEGPPVNPPSQGAPENPAQPRK